MSGGVAASLFAISLFVPQNISELATADLLKLVNGSDRTERVSATKELFRRGPAILGALRAAGAKPMATIAPPRGDVVYTVLSGLSSPRVSRAVFGLHFDGDVTRHDVEQMGARNGFELDRGAKFSLETFPNCYVRLANGRDLAAVLENILLTEPLIRTINLDYPERTEK